MKPIVLHPGSVLVGAALVGLSLLLSGATQSPGVVHRPRPELVGVIPAEWWVALTLQTGCNGTLVSTFTVPSDRYLAVTVAEDNGRPMYADGVDVTTRLAPFLYNYSRPLNDSRLV